MIVNTPLTIIYILPTTGLSMDTLDGFKTVIAVVETGSFTAASERLGLSKALVSKYINQIETQLNVRLFNRSTRRLVLTEAGKNYYQGALPLLENYSQLLDNVMGEQNKPRGLIRISTSVTFGDTVLSPHLPNFLKAFPDIEIDLQLSDRKIDMLEEGIDVVIRIGSLDDSNLVAKKINQFPLVVCASPLYLAEFGQPTTPEQLTEHNCIIDSNFRVAKQWPFTDPQGNTLSVMVNSNISVNSPRSVKALAIAHAGIALAPRFIVQQALDNDLLKAILTDYKTLEFDMFAIYPHRRYLPQKVRCFIDFLSGQLSGEILA